MSKNSNFELCRLCGFIRYRKAEGKICPACGAPATTFVPCQYNVSLNRRRYLELDAHPVIVHFTISYTYSLAVLFVLSYFTMEFLGINIRDSGLLDFFVKLFPVFVIAGGAAGLVDAKIRYKKLQTPYIKLKIILGAILIVTSVLVYVLHISSDGEIMSLEAILILFSAFIAALLGWFGAKLDGPIVPRGMEKKINK